MLHVNQPQKPFLSAFPASREIRCLLLDDNVFDRVRIRRMTKRTELAIFLEEVDSIEQLAQAVNSASYDVILIDYHLPEGDGLIALNQIMQSAQNRDSGKIMLTGIGAEHTAQEALHAGCHDYLVKEKLSVENLRKAIIAALANAKRQHALTAQSIRRRNERRRGLMLSVCGSNLTSDGVQEEGLSLRDPRFGSHAGRSCPDVPDFDVEALLAAIDNRSGYKIH